MTASGGHFSTDQTVTPPCGRNAHHFHHRSHRYYIPSWLLFCSNQTKWTTFYPNRCHIYLARRYFIACTTECIGTNLQEKFKQQYLIPKNLISKTQAVSYTALGCLLSRLAVLCFTHTMCETQCSFYISLINQFLNYQNSSCLTVIQNKTKYYMIGAGIGGFYLCGFFLKTFILIVFSI